MKIARSPSTALYPVPVVLVSCGIEQPNLITLAWAGTVCSEPPAVAIGVRPSRFSHGLIAASGEFVVNLPRASQVAVVDYCGQVSGRDRDKWADCELTQVPAKEVRTRLVAECPVALECRVIHRLSLGTHDLFIGQVVAVQVEETALNQNGTLDYDRLDPLAYVGGNYWQLGAPLGGYGDWRPRTRSQR